MVMVGVVISSSEVDSQPESVGISITIFTVHFCNILLGHVINCKNIEMASRHIVVGWLI